MKRERLAHTADQRGKSDGQQDPVAKGTATLIYSPCKLSEMEPQEEQYWARRGIGGHMVIGNQKSRQSPGSHGDICYSCSASHPRAI